MNYEEAMAVIENHIDCGGVLDQHALAIAIATDSPNPASMAKGMEPKIMVTCEFSGQIEDLEIIDVKTVDDVIYVAVRIPQPTRTALTELIVKWERWQADGDKRGCPPTNGLSTAIHDLRAFLTSAQFAGEIK